MRASTARAAIVFSTALALLGLFSAPVSGQCVEDSFEPDDACAPDATILYGASPQTHAFCNDAEDWIRFNACAGREYVVTTGDVGALADTSLELYGPGCDSQITAVDAGGPGSGETLEWTATADGTHHLRIRQSDATTGPDREYEVAVDGDTTSCGTWTHVLRGAADDRLPSFVTLDDGGFVFGGTTASGGAGAEDLLLAEYAAAGYLVRQWTVGSALAESGRRLRITPDGGLLLVGWIEDPGAPVPEESRDGLAVRLDAEGNVDWAVRLGGAERDELHGLAALGDGGAIAVGETHSAGNPAGPRAWAVRLSAAGAVQWSSTYGGAGDTFADARTSRDGGLVVAGSIGGTRGRVARLDENGAVQWSRTISLDSPQTESLGYAVTEMSDGGIAAGGVSLVTQYEEVSWVVRLDASGNHVWNAVLSYPALPPSHASVHSLREARDGGLIAGMLAGYAIRWPTLAKLDPAGALEWARNYLPSEWAEEGPVQDIEAIPGGGYIGAASPYEWDLGAFNASSFVTDDLGAAEGCATFTPSELYRSTHESADVGTDNPKRNAFDVTAQDVTLSLAESVLPAVYECRTCAPPGYHGGIRIVADGDETTVSWTLGNAQAFDVIRGDLDVLLATAGDFDAAMSQPVGRCLADDTTATEVTVVYPSPDPGEGYFYLLRAVKLTCPVGGSYDTGSSSQAGARDEGIAGGLWSCP